MAVLGLRFCERAFSSCGKWGPLFIAVQILSLLRPLLLRSTGSRRAGSVIVAHGPSRSAACGILPDQGPNPCSPHRQADSQPLHHQGSPYCSFVVSFEIRKCEFSTIFRIILSILAPLHFHVNFRISLSISAKKPVGIFMGIVLSLWINLRSIAILTILSSNS